MKSVLIGDQRVVLGDCIEGMGLMRAGNVDVITTSPLYNIGMDYSKHKDRMDDSAYLSWMGDVAAACRRVLKPGGSIFLNVGSNGTRPWTAIDVACAFRKYLVLQNIIVWVKSVAIGDRTHGHFRPITSKRYLNGCHEMIYHFSLDGNVELDRLAIGVPYTGERNPSRFGHGRQTHCRGNTWHIGYETVHYNEQRFNHPAAFPLTLPYTCMRLHGGKGLRVLDPFLGTGTTLLASAMLGHRGVGFDVDPAYARTAVSRLRSLSSKT